MTIGVGTCDRQTAIDSLSNMTGNVQPISDQEFQERLNKLQAQLKEAGATAVYLHAGTNLYYFCLLYTSPSPRDLSTSRMPSSA